MKESKNIIWTDEVYDFMWYSLKQKFGEYSEDENNPWADFRRNKEFRKFAKHFIEVIGSTSTILFMDNVVRGLKENICEETHQYVHIKNRNYALKHGVININKYTGDFE